MPTPLFPEMKIPHGLTCGDCRLYERCHRIINKIASSTDCDFYPVAFAVDLQQYAENKAEIARLKGA